MRHSATRFLIVGGLSWAVDLSILHLLVYAGLAVWLAAGLAWSTGFATNYLLNRAWSFGGTAAWGASAWKYVTLAAVNAAVTVVVMELTDRAGFDLTISKTALTAVLAVANYFAYRVWVFASSGSSDAAGSAR